MRTIDKINLLLKARPLAAAEVLGVSAIWLLTEHNNISVETEKDPATGGEVLEDDLRHYSTFRTKEKAPQTIAVVYRGSCLKVRAEALTNHIIILHEIAPTVK